MTLQELINLIYWDVKINRGLSWDSLRAKLLLFEVRIEQFIYRNIYRQNSPFVIFWYFFRFFGSIFQWFVCNSNIPGTITIGRGLRLPHPQNIILLGYADIGEFCTIYQNVTIAWNGFIAIKPGTPKIGNKVLIGTGVIILGDLSIGTNVLIGAGTVVTRSVPDNSRVIGCRAEITERIESDNAAEPGSERHIKDPYSIWR